MKTFNEPEPEVKPEPEKPKRQRPYISVDTEDINELINDYRKCLKRETGSVREVLIGKIEELEKELRFRSKLPKTSK